MNSPRATMLPIPALRRPFFANVALAAVTLSMACSVGCSFKGSAGSLRAQGLGDNPALLSSDFKKGFFSNESTTGPSFMLFDVPIDDVVQGNVQNGQMLHIDLLWLPKPGTTPIDSAATNAIIRYVIVAHGEVGVFGGAGFAMPDGSPESNRMGLTLRDASLQLQESTPGFIDLLSPAQLTGTFTAARDDKLTKQMNYAASQFVTNALGRTRYVRRD